MIVHSGVESPRFHSTGGNSSYLISGPHLQEVQLQSNLHASQPHSLRSSPSSYTLPPILSDRITPHLPGQHNNNLIGSLHSPLNQTSIPSNRNSPGFSVTSSHSFLENPQSAQSFYPVSPYLDNESLQRLMPPPPVPLKTFNQPRYSNTKRQFSEPHHIPNPNIQVYAITSGSSVNLDGTEMIPQPPSAPRPASTHSLLKGKGVNFGF